jgi:hypothetical protein
VASAGETVPILTTASRAERATLRAARAMARREAELLGRRAHLELKDGLAITADELERLTTCHRATYRKLDWRPIAARQTLALPPRGHEREKAARRALANYQPKWRERMFAEVAQRRRKLNEQVLEAVREDELIHRRACNAAATHNAEVLTARRLLDLDPAAIKETIVGKTQLAALRDSMNSLAIARTGRGVVALVDAVQDGDMPYERITGGGSRDARREPIPAAERRQIHLASLCALALRVGADLVAVLPVEAVEVAVRCELAGSEGARSQAQLVLQLRMTDEALTELDWAKGEATSLAASLGARMDWSAERGFAAIPFAGSPAPAARPLRPSPETPLQAARASSPRTSARSS